MFRKPPTDIGKSVLIIWIALGIVIIIALIQIDRLMEALAQLIFN